MRKKKGRKGDKTATYVFEMEFKKMISVIEVTAADLGLNRTKAN